MIETSGHVYKLDQEDGQSAGGCLEVFRNNKRLRFFLQVFPLIYGLTDA